MMNIILLCILLCSIQFTFSATAPTKKPIFSPTAKPSRAPTPNPTVAPTLSPTQIPTFSPTTLAPIVPLMTNPPDVVKNASSKGGKVAGAFLGILFAASIVYLWYTKTYGPVFNSHSVPDDELNIEVKNPISTNQHNNNNIDDKF